MRTCRPIPRALFCSATSLKVNESRNVGMWNTRNGVSFTVHVLAITHNKEMKFFSKVIFIRPNFPLAIKMLVNKDSDLSSNSLQSSHDKLMPLSLQQFTACNFFLYAIPFKNMAFNNVKCLIPWSAMYTSLSLIT